MHIYNGNGCHALYDDNDDFGQVACNTRAAAAGPERVNFYWNDWLNGGELNIGCSLSLSRERERRRVAGPRVYYNTAVKYSRKEG